MRLRCEVPALSRRNTVKSVGEIMEALEAFDLTGSLRDAGELAGCSHNTVGRYVMLREAGGQLDKAAARPQLIDEFLPKVQEWVKHSKGKIRADKAHEKLRGLGYRGSERTTRRAVRAAKAEYHLGQVRVHRPWVTEPGMWLKYDFGDGPVIDGRKTVLFCVWLAWSRFRVVLALRDRTAPTAKVDNPSPRAQSLSSLRDTHRTAALRVSGHRQQRRFGISGWPPSLRGPSESRCDRR